MSACEPHSNSIEIRRMGTGDIPAVRALWRAADLPARLNGRDAAEALVRQLSHPDVVYLVAEREGQLLGVVLGTHDQRKGWINRLAVHPEGRRRGVGRRLVQACEAELFGRGVDIVAALVERGNDASAGLLAGADYEELSVRYFRKLRHPEA